METYANAAKWAQLPNSPTADELKLPFKQAYKENLLSKPCFRNDPVHFSSRQWWVDTVKRTLELCGRNYTDAEFNRFFRRVYQHYGSLSGYEILPDTIPFLDSLAQNAPHICLGVTTNTPARSIETVLPMVGLHDRFKFFVCCQDVGVEKPGKEIFEEAYNQAKFWVGNDLKKDEVLHIGDNLAADLCGARAYGFQSLLLDRSGNPRVTVYQDWLKAPDYPGKSEKDIENCSVKDFSFIQDLFSVNNNK